MQLLNQIMFLFDIQIFFIVSNCSLIKKITLIILSQDRTYSNNVSHDVMIKNNYVEINK